MSRSVLAAAVLAAGLLLTPLPGTASGAGAAEPRPYRLSAVSLKQRVIWGATCEAPDGTALSFGGEDQGADDGAAHTRFRTGGQWADLHDTLVRTNPLAALHDRAWAMRESQKQLLAHARFLYLEGLPADEGRRRGR